MDPARITDLQTVFVNVVKVAIAAAGIALFVMLLIGGFKYITSGGDPKATEGAQRTITYAIGGLVLILAAYLILLLIRTITGAQVTNFTVVQ
jgi:hypothetical protein